MTEPGLTPSLSPSPLDVDRLLRETFVAQVEHHRELGSTNDRAKQCASQGNGPLPILVVADRQTAGRGRGSNRWWTGEGSLACSLLVDLAAAGVDRSRAPVLALAAGLAVVEAVEAVEAVAPLLPGHTLGIHWPNDVFAAGKKLAGVLVEGLPAGLYVVGIGVNTDNTIAEAPAELCTTATTLRDLTGTRHDRTRFLVELLGHLEAMLRRLGSAPDEIGRLADARCLQRGRELEIESGSRTVAGTCAGIAPDGALLLDTPAGRMRLLSGTVRRR